MKPDLAAPGPAGAGGDAAPPQGVRDYIESMLDQLAELAKGEGEARITVILRTAALEVSRLPS